jgi:hypothetical protein
MIFSDLRYTEDDVIRTNQFNRKQFFRDIAPQVLERRYVGSRNLSKRNPK